MKPDDWQEDTETVAEQRFATKRQRSTISFPYMDLSASLEVAKAAFERNGSADCQLDELAAQMKLSPTSSGFRVRVAAARMFGLVNAARGSDYISVTDLGLRSVENSTARKARADAFLRIELFKRVYDEFKGRSLPLAAGLERQMEAFGVAPKQAERARQILERSAETAGFFESGRDRLVRPAGLGSESTAEQNTEEPPRKTSSRPSHNGNRPWRGEDSKAVDPLITALFSHLPPRGTAWPKAERDAWLGLVKGTLDFIYCDDDEESLHDLIDR